MIKPSPETPAPLANDRPATFGLRTLAKLTDLLVVNIASAVLFCAFAVFQAGGSSSIALLLWLGGAFILFSIFYLAVGMSGGRQTLGYRLAGLQVVLEESGARPLSLGRGLARSVLDWVCYGLATYGIGLVDYMPVAVTPAKRALHDIATGTRVVMVNRPQYFALALCAALLVIVPVGMVFGVIRPFLMQSFNAPSPAMAPTLPPDSHFLVNKLCYRGHGPRRGDIVAFQAPANAAAYVPPGANLNYVKRIIGLPGEELRMAHGKVFIYGRGALLEPYIKAGYARELPLKDNLDDQDDWFEKRRSALVQHNGVWWIKVPSGQFFVLGDNRNNSNDSHIWGFVPVGNIFGKVTLVYSPVVRDL